MAPEALEHGYVQHLAIERPSSALNQLPSWRTTTAGRVKGKVSLALYAAAIPLAFVHPWISDALFLAVALIWFIPDPRIEKVAGAGPPPDHH